MNEIPVGLKYKSGNVWYVVKRHVGHYLAVTETSFHEGDNYQEGPMEYLETCKQADELNEICEVMES